MQKTRRSVLAATGASGLAALAAGAAASGDPAVDQSVAELLRRSEEANAALLRGDVAAYRRLITLAEDFTLMSPFGGRPSHGAEITEESWKSMGRFFRNGSLQQQVVQAYGCPDMVVLAVIEHGHGEVGGLPAQAWPLRVTLVYRRDAGQWRLAHRHADPLVVGITLQQAAGLARAQGDGIRP